MNKKITPKDIIVASGRIIPWNKDKAVGGKKHFTEKEVEFLKDLLIKKNLLQELALLFLGLDTLFRASDLLRLKFSDVLDFQGKPKKEVRIKQKKTKHTAIGLIGEKTGEYLSKLQHAEDKTYDDYVFTSRKPSSGEIKKTPMSRGKFAKIIKEWAKSLGLNPYDFSTHSLRKTSAKILWDNTKDLEVCRWALQQKTSAATIYYLGVEKEDMMNIRRQYMMS